MTKLKAFIAHMFESKWTYSDDLSTRTHKVTGEVQYVWFDAWGTWYDPEPMFPWEHNLESAK